MNTMEKTDKTRIIIDGDISDEDLKKIGSFVAELYHGRKEHVNVDIQGRTEQMSAEEVLSLTDGMFGDKPHFTAVIKKG